MFYQYFFAFFSKFFCEITEINGVIAIHCKDLSNTAAHSACAKNSEEDLTYYEKLYQAYPEQFSLKNCLENFESSLIKSVLDHTHNTYKAAEILKVDQSSISRKINKYHISYNKRMEIMASPLCRKYGEEGMHVFILNGKMCL